MDTGQAKIFDWLRQVEPRLAELYEGAVRLIEDQSFPGRGRLICHAVREIRNRLPDAVAGKGTSNRLDYRQEIDKLADAYERSGFGSVRKQSKQTGEEQQSGREVFVLLEQIIKENEKVKPTKEQNAKRLLIEIEPDNKQWQQSLVPVVEKWIEETEWFVQRAHVGKQIDGNKLVERFMAFEEVLLSLVGYFYEGQQELENLVEETNRVGKEPDREEINRIVRRLGRAKYRIYFFDKLSNPYWIEPLKQKGFFKSPGEPKEGEAYERWPEGWYLKRMSANAAEKVLWVISEIESRNPYVRAACMECLLEMPEKVAAKGVSVIKNTFPSGAKQGDLGWIWCGEKAAELMVKLADHHQAEAFKIGWILLDAWIPQDQKGFRDIIAKFTEHDYIELVLEYFRKMWEVDTWEAIWVMFKTLNRCLEKLDERDEYDVSSLFYAGQDLRDLDSIDVGHWGIESVLVKGICEAGRLLAKNDPAKLSKLLDELEKSKRAIFLRVEMYLLRFVGPGFEKDRINKIIADKKYLEDPCYEYEYKLLLRDKFDEVGEGARNAFVEWIKEQKISGETRKEIEEYCERNSEPKPDFEKMEACKKAEKLYLVRDKFIGLYGVYKAKAEVDDIALMPRRMVGEARWVSPMEGTPLEPEDMAKMSAPEVLDYVLKPENYEGEKAWEVGDFCGCASCDVQSRRQEAALGVFGM